MYQNDCVGNFWLHNYKILQQTSNKTRELCTRCKTVTIFNKSDNRTYFKEHRRDYLQPTESRFHREWGEPNYAHIKKKQDDQGSHNQEE